VKKVRSPDTVRTRGIAEVRYSFVRPRIFNLVRNEPIVLSGRTARAQRLRMPVRRAPRPPLFQLSVPRSMRSAGSTAHFAVGSAVVAFLGRERFVVRSPGFRPSPSVRAIAERRSEYEGAVIG
jgi:hypothetical protein